jgi:acetyl-CoA synthetase
MTKIPANIYKRRDGLTPKKYAALYEESIQHPEKFWEKQAALLDFTSPSESVLSGDWTKGDARWFDKGRLNACYNCVDRHLEKNGDDIALIWQGENPEETLKINYNVLHQKVSRCANILKRYGIERGDVVGIYLPMIPEAIISMLACARIGAIHCVVFAGFSAEALSNRLNETDCRLVITADEELRGGKSIPLKKQVDTALENSPQVKRVVVVRRTGNRIPWIRHRDVFYDKVEQQVNAHCECVDMESEDPLFILYTSGSTGKPKGILHTTAGYLLYTALTFKITFDYQPGDIYWCTADVGWITGHSYNVYGPLANRATVVIYEGIPSYPDPSRFWQIIDQHNINILFTAPTAIRALMREGDKWLETTKRDSLRILGTVGEPINPSVWEWYFKVVGNSKCPIIDAWWQTETGGFLITPIAGITPLKPGSATKPFWGIKPALSHETDGNLVITAPWPALMRTVYKDHARFINSYLKSAPNAYFTGDGARCDKTGYYYITGRIDDIINTSGHRLSTAEIESSLVIHPDIAEAAVVSYPHDIKGEGVYAFVTPKAQTKISADLRKELIELVCKKIGSIAKPDLIHFAPALPKTRSGKIMRRILRKIAGGETKDFGDISTLADPEILQDLLSRHSSLQAKQKSYKRENQKVQQSQRKKK